MSSSPSRLLVADSDAVHAVEEKLKLTWRLLLRCVWKCLREHQAQQMANPASQGTRVSLRDNLKHRAVGAQKNVSKSTSSRQVYRDVMSEMSRAKHEQSLCSSAPAYPRGELRDAKDLEIFHRSASFTVLRSSLAFLLSVTFLRRLHHLACVLRPAQARVASQFACLRVLQRVFFPWRRHSREAARWRRWVLRRCVQQWVLYVERRRTISSIVRTFCAAVSHRSSSFRAVCLRRKHRVWKQWCYRLHQATVQARLEHSCVKYVTHKNAANAQFALRQLLKHTHETTAIPLAVHRPSVCSRAFCFNIWRQRTERRLECFYAVALHNQSLVRSCLRTWRLRTVFVDSLASEAVDHATVVVVAKHHSASSMLYRLQGYQAHRAIHLRRNLLLHWRARVRCVTADRQYLRTMLTQTLERWMHATAFAHTQRMIKRGVLAAWQARYYTRARLLHAEAWHHRGLTQNCWTAWKLRATLRAWSRWSNRRRARQCLDVWYSQAKVLALRRCHERTRFALLFSKWRVQAAAREQTRTRELVAEALCDHITITKGFRLWKRRWAEASEERQREAVSFQVLDSMREERLRRCLFGLWRAKCGTRPQQLAIIDTQTRDPFFR